MTKHMQVIRAIENGIKMDKSPVRLSMMTKGYYDPCEHCKDWDCAYCTGRSGFFGMRELMIFFYPKDGEPCGKSVFVKSFYKPTETGIATHVYAITEGNSSHPKKEWCFNTLRDAVNAFNAWLDKNGYVLDGYVGYDHENRRWDSL